MNDSYNYDTFTRDEYTSIAFREQIRIGNRAPDFEAELLNGGMIRLSELRGKSNVVLVFGSITCPPSIGCLKSAENSLEKLYEEYRDKGFEFFLVYVREAHPGEAISHHLSYEQKKVNAERMQKEEKVGVPIIVDDLEGHIHNSYGSRPNMLYVISRQGLIVYKSDWADTEELRQFFENLLNWEAARKESRPHKVAYSERLHYVPEDDLELRRRVYLRAGQKAVEDYTKAMSRKPF
ncbi:MAG: TlpA family protein disulfide reductase [Thaumarchaeota archaeon]|nr:TlpA family protein disulfide reductase [Nitrososphaerota archaeon]